MTITITQDSSVVRTRVVSDEHLAKTLTQISSAVHDRGGATGGRIERRRSLIQRSGVVHARAVSGDTEMARFLRQFSGAYHDRAVSDTGSVRPTIHQFSSVVHPRSIVGNRLNWVSGEFVRRDDLETPFSLVDRGSPTRNILHTTNEGDLFLRGDLTIDAAGKIRTAETGFRAEMRSRVYPFRFYNSSLPLLAEKRDGSVDSATTLVVSFQYPQPASIIVAFAACEETVGTRSLTISGSGWTAMPEQTNATGKLRARMWWKVEDGTSSVTFTSSPAGPIVGGIYRYQFQQTPIVKATGIVNSSAGTAALMATGVEATPDSAAIAFIVNAGTVAQSLDGEYQSYMPGKNRLGREQSVGADDNYFTSIGSTIVGYSDPGDVVSPSRIAVETAGNAGDGIFSPLREVTVGETYTASVYLQSGEDPASVRVGIEWLNSTGSSISVDESSTVVPAEFSQDRVSATGTAPAGAVTANVYVRQPSSGTGYFFYTGQWQFELGSVANPWVMGRSDADSWRTVTDRATAGTNPLRLGQYTRRNSDPERTFLITDFASSVQFLTYGIVFEGHENRFLVTDAGDVEIAGGITAGDSTFHNIDAVSVKATYDGVRESFSEWGEFGKLAFIDGGVIEGYTVQVSSPAGPSPGFLPAIELLNTPEIVFHDTDVSDVARFTLTGAIASGEVGLHLLPASGQASPYLALQIRSSNPPSGAGSAYQVKMFSKQRGNRADRAGLFIQDMDGMQRGLFGAAYLDGPITTARQVANTTTETDLLTWAIPADDLEIGATYRMVLSGLISNIATSGTLGIRIRYGSTQLQLITLASQGTLKTDSEYWFEGLVTCHAIGGSGSLSGSIFQRNAFTGSTTSGAGIPVTADTTAANSLRFTAKWATADAGNDLRAIQGYLERIK